jgi:TetR/AcrR family transcriptional regulator, lmrAB and yxaGH operons repressor
MASSKVSRQDILKAALDLFRAFGFEGVSLNDISRKTGLEKPSLYFKFPGGKEQIALEALGEAIRFFSERIFGPLSAIGDPEEKVQVAIGGLRAFYEDGTKPCVTGALSFTAECPEVVTALNRFLHTWIEAFSMTAEEGGIAGEEARTRAERAIIVIQGSLILSRVLGDPSPFRRALLEIPDALLKPEGPG